MAMITSSSTISAFNPFANGMAVPSGHFLRNCQKYTARELFPSRFHGGKIKILPGLLTIHILQVD
jgi:hypothetical protein